MSVSRRSNSGRRESPMRDLTEDQIINNSDNPYSGDEEENLESGRHQEGDRIVDSDDQAIPSRQASRDRSVSRARKLPEQEPALENTIYVHNLPYSLDEEGVKDFFAAAGDVLSAKMLMSKSGRPKGMATVTFADEDGMNRAIEEFNGKEVDGGETKHGEKKEPRKLKVRQDKGVGYISPESMKRREEKGARKGKGKRAERKGSKGNRVRKGEPGGKKGDRKGKGKSGYGKGRDNYRPRYEDRDYGYYGSRRYDDRDDYRPARRGDSRRGGDRYRSPPREDRYNNNRSYRSRSPYRGDDRYDERKPAPIRGDSRRRY